MNSDAGDEGLQNIFGDIAVGVSHGATDCGVSSREERSLTEKDESTETDRLLDRLAHGDRSVLDEVLTANRPYVKRIAELRMGEDLRGRIDASDIVQATSMVVTRRIDDFLQRRPTSFRIWLRRKVLEQIVDARRYHLAKKRTPRKEVYLSNASSMCIARQLIAGRPSQIAQRKELANQVRAIIEQMSENDREILLLRHVEELSNAEVAEVLELELATVRKRHGRALRRLGENLSAQGLSL